MAKNQKLKEEVLAQAVEIRNESERGRFLDSVCEGDAEFRSVVESMVADFFAAGSLLDGPNQLETTGVETVDLPMQIGNYKLREKIDEGGMGIVYVADQLAPLKRRVALKIIRPGLLDSQQVVARFQSERQALALMNHPNIAKVFDGGTTEDGRPYFVMELVKGISICKFCEERKLDNRARLELFVKICGAVEHAHQKGIIHRDLKPANILVCMENGEAEPKVIDFGIAKATGAQMLSDESVYTAFAQLMGTPMYMSPEQAEMNNLDIDTRSDIYSLGVVLYELLTGTTPFDKAALKHATYDELRQIICEKEPQRPSDRVSTLAARKDETLTGRYDVDPRRLADSLQGELDWIVTKAMDKDRSRRYQTSREFAEDVYRFLGDEPVHACPPSRRYRLYKSMRRNRVALLTTSLVFAAMVIGLIGTASQAIRATNAEAETRKLLASEKIARRTADEERDRADDEAALAKNQQAIAEKESKFANTISNFLQHELFASSAIENQMTMGLEPDPDIKVRTLLDRAVDGIVLLENDPMIQASVSYTIGSAYNSLGLFDQAEPLLERAVTISRNVVGLDNPGSWRAIRGLGALRVNQNRLLEAESLIFESFDYLKNSSANQDSEVFRETLHDLVVLRFYQQRYEEAKELAEQLVKNCERNLLPNDPFTLGARHSLAAQYSGLGLHSEAEMILRRLLKTLQETNSTDETLELSTIGSLAARLNSKGQYAEAETMFQQQADRYHELFGPEHPSTLLAKANLGRVLTNQSKYDEAEEVLLATMQKAEERYGKNHPATQDALGYLAIVYEAQKRYNEAWELSQQKHQFLLKQFGERNYDVLALRDRNAGLLYNLGKKDESEQERLGIIEISGKEWGSMNEPTLSFMGNLGVQYQSEGRDNEALELFKKVHSANYKKDKNSNKTLLAEFNLAFVMNKLGQTTEATALLEGALPRIEQQFGQEHRLAYIVRIHLGTIYLNDQSLENRYLKSEAIFRKAFEFSLKKLGLNNPKTHVAMGWVATALIRTKGPQAADEFLRVQFDKTSEAFGPNHANTIRLYEIAAKTLMSYEQHAVPHTQQLFQSFQTTLGPNDPKTHAAFKKLISCLCFYRQFDQAAKLTRQYLKSLTEASVGPEDSFDVVLESKLLLARVLSWKAEYEPVFKVSPEVEQILKAALEHQWKRDGTFSKDIRNTQIRLALLYEFQRRDAESEKQRRETLEACKASQVAGHAGTVSAMLSLAKNLGVQGEFDEAEALIQKSIELKLASGVSATSSQGRILTMLYLDQDNLVAAEQSCRESLAQRNLITTNCRLGLIYQLQGRSQEAVEHLESLIGQSEASTVQIRESRSVLADVYLMQGKHAEAESIARAALNAAVEAERYQSPGMQTMTAQHKLGQTLVATGKFDEAAIHLTASIGNRSRVSLNKYWIQFSAMSLLGECMLQKSNHDEAENLLLDGYHGVKNHLDFTIMSRRQRRQLLRRCTDRLIAYYTATTNSEELKKWEKERENWIDAQ